MPPSAAFALVGAVRIAAFAAVYALVRVVRILRGLFIGAAEILQFAVEFVFADLLGRAVVIAAFGAQDLCFGRFRVNHDALFGGFAVHQRADIWVLVRGEQHGGYAGQYQQGFEGLGEIHFGFLLAGG